MIISIQLRLEDKCKNCCMAPQTQDGVSAGYQTAWLFLSVHWSDVLPFGANNEARAVKTQPSEAVVTQPSLPKGKTVSRPCSV